MTDTGKRSPAMPLGPLAGLVSLGDADTAQCAADGFCAVPTPAQGGKPVAGASDLSESIKPLLPIKPSPTTI